MPAQISAFLREMGTMPFEIWWLCYPLLGVGVGFIAGLLGVGGGGIMVPVLTALFVVQGGGANHVIHLALGTSMAIIAITSLSSLHAHHRHGAVRWDIVRSFTPGVLLGTFAGTFLASQISTRPLAIFYTVFTACIALQMIVNFKPKASRRLPGPLGLSGVGLGIGVISALVAIGGGSMTVPFLNWCNVAMNRAIGTSAAIGLPIALAGALGYLFNGLGSTHTTPSYSIGFIYLPALLLVSATSLLTAPYGARMAHKLPVATLKKIFACLLVLLCAKMLQTLFTTA